VGVTGAARGAHGERSAGLEAGEVGGGERHPVIVAGSALNRITLGNATCDIGRRHRDRVTMVGRDLRRGDTRLAARGGRAHDRTGAGDRHRVGMTEGGGRGHHDLAFGLERREIRGGERDLVRVRAAQRVGLGDAGGDVGRGHRERMSVVGADGGADGRAGAELVLTVPDVVGIVGGLGHTGGERGGGGEKATEASELDEGRAASDDVGFHAPRSITQRWRDQRREALDPFRAGNGSRFSANRSR